MCATAILTHNPPKARKREQLNAKHHWNAVTEDYLMKALTKAPDDSKAYETMPKAERSTLHGDTRAEHLAA